MCRTGVKPVRGGEGDDDRETGDQQEDDGDLQSERRVAPLVIHLRNFLRIIFQEKYWILIRIIRTV